MTDCYAVFGQPISHSKSPRIHGFFAAQTGQDLSYTAQEVAPEHFTARVGDFFAAGGLGLNCTVPLKELAFDYAQVKTPRAERAKAVNTLKRLPDGAVLGDNTDGGGLVTDLLDNHHLTLAGQRILLLGAGGASRGILAPLLEQCPHSLRIANRTAAKAEQLAAEFADLGAVSGGGFADLAGQCFDLILNATSASLSGQLPPLPAGLLSPGGVCYDLAYGNQPTAFVRWGQAQGAAHSLDGLGMLIEQAAEAFRLWRGIHPDSAPLIALFDHERTSL
ncbi:shikimate dehydrogenase [Methylovulum psychrotolerans]|uniref:Shikimate dehydrogenase (NADP(+)) n=1 Tax=Methylovulum psychrotolerans TaxID=1704499 RepID=A0A2S5CI08_9GAMM|nr:shikimate dehydrogenase [Methylovulum psychrotolerans]POZ50397.1 shikimate dehydrogenase [Methylovulum psychrotolerans]